MKVNPKSIVTSTYLSGRDYLGKQVRLSEMNPRPMLAYCCALRANIDSRSTKQRDQ